MNPLGPLTRSQRIGWNLITLLVAVLCAAHYVQEALK